MCRDCEALEGEIEALEDEIEQARQALDQLADFCRAVIDRAETTLSRPSGVPRGEWSRLKGRVDVAQAVLAALRSTAPEAVG
jgi:hypothetical protein